MFLGERCSGLSILCSYLAGRTGGKRNFRQAEIENLGVSALGYKNVGRLDGAMNNSFCVGGIERVRNLDGQRKN